MKTGETEILRMAQELDEAVRMRRELTRYTAKNPALTNDDGYRVQDAGLCLRIERGERIVGYKMGLTSKAKMAQMGVTSPISGVLTSAMQIENGGVIRLANRIHPKVEPEIAFITKRDLEGELTREEFLDACDSVVAAIEVIDSRYENFDFRLPDVLADNCSSSGFLIGSVQQNPRQLALDSLKIELKVNGQLVQSGKSDAILGHPADSALEIVKILTAQGKILPKFSIILAGSATAAHSVQAGDRVEISVDSLGTVSASVE